MMNLFKRYDLEVIKNKFFLIYILNASDILFTTFLLSTGNFFEANIFIRPFINDEFTITILKFVVPIILLYYIFKRMGSATEKQLHISNLIINFCLIFYMVINLSHIICTTSYFLGYL